MNCFVCSEYLNGDDQFIQSHLNQCLDRQGSSSSTPLASNTSPPSLSQNYTASTSIPSQQDADLALALSLAQQQPSPSRDRQLALSLAQQENQSISRDSSDSSSCCPCCQVYWGEIGLSRLNDESDETEKQRRRHIERCLEARTKSGVEGGHGEWELDDKGDDTSVIGIGSGGSRWEVGKAGGMGWNGGIGTKFEVKGTPHLLPLLRQALQKSHLSPHGRTQTAYLVSNNTLHIGTKFNDWGWGCGYKNLQMLFSSLRHLPQYDSHLRSLLGSPTSQGEIPIPTIQELQRMIEHAWSLGFDPPGAAHFGGKLVGSRKWIGTTEVYTALIFLGIRAKMVDFPKVKKSDLRGGEREDVATHQTLIKWIISYFSTPSSASSDSSSSSSASPPPTNPPKNAYTALLSSSSTSHPVKTPSKTTKQPLYLQHQGHSRTIVGIERMKRSGSGGEGQGDEWLLLFDPGKPISNDLKSLATSASAAPASSSSSDSTSQEPLSKRFKPNGFGRLSSTKQSSSTNDWKFGDVLKGFRVNMKDLKKRDEYQILYVEEDGAPLSEMERMKRRKVISQAAK